MVNRRGEFLTRDVNINSNLDAVLASTHNACVRPRSLLFAFLMFTEIIEFKPILKFIFEFAWAIQRIRRFVTIRDPLSPLFPFVSSTELIESITFSPLLQASRGGFESNRSSLSCQIYSTTFSFPFILLQPEINYALNLSGCTGTYSVPDKTNTLDSGKRTQTCRCGQLRSKWDVRKFLCFRNFKYTEEIPPIPPAQKGHTYVLVHSHSCLRIIKTQHQWRSQGTCMTIKA